VDHDIVVVDARPLAADFLRDRVTLLLEPGFGGHDRVLAVEERKELPPLRVLVVEDEHAVHAFGRRHLTRRPLLLHDLVGLLRIDPLERGDPHPHAATSLVDASQVGT